MDKNFIFTLKGKKFRTFISEYGVLLFEGIKGKNNAWNLIGWTE